MTQLDIGAVPLVGRFCMKRALITGVSGQAIWDSSKPDGMPRKLLDVTRLNALGWKPQIDLRLGIRKTYQWYLKATENP